MIYKIFALILIAAGAALIAWSAYRYARLIRLSVDETYKKMSGRDRAGDVVCMGLLCFFFAAYVAAGIYISFQGDSFYDLLIGLIFAGGGLFVAYMVVSQISMTKVLRLKTTEVLKILVNSIEMKDAYTFGHSQHVHKVVGVFYDHLPDALRKQIVKTKLLDAALLHDIGKIGVNDSVLNKKGVLNAGEWNKVKEHPSVGKKLLDSTSFAEIENWVLYHHEHIDGTGYYHIAGAEIPLEARIIAIADVYSALTTDRIYRTRYTHKQAIEMMAKGRGTQFDAGLFAVFETIDGALLVNDNQPAKSI
jgi:HD-GYP domain-containing protein (c-di-GMP phosphodiesterase class II)